MEESRAALWQPCNENLRADRLLHDFRFALPVIDESEAVFEQFKKMLPGSYLPDQTEMRVGIARINKHSQRFFEALLNGILQTVPRRAAESRLLKSKGSNLRLILSREIEIDNLKVLKYPAKNAVGFRARHACRLESPKNCNYRRTACGYQRKTP
jgi:hypothetical protein